MDIFANLLTDHRNKWDAYHQQTKMGHHPMVNPLSFQLMELIQMMYRLIQWASSRQSPGLLCQPRSVSRTQLLLSWLRSFIVKWMWHSKKIHLISELLRHCIVCIHTMDYWEISLSRSVIVSKARRKSVAIRTFRVFTSFHKIRSFVLV